MDSIKEVAKILGNLVYEVEHCDYRDPIVGREVKQAAQQICQLFEPKPEMSMDEAREIVRNAFGSRPDLPSGKDFVDAIRHGKKPKPDESRLLTDEEILEILDGHWENFLIKWYREKLIAKTASIKDKLCQERVERVFEEIDRILGIFSYGDGSSINLEDNLLALKDKYVKQEGVK